MALAKKKEERSDDRIHARINSTLKARIQHAADLKGLDLTSYVVSTLVEAADKVVRENEILELSQRDRLAFAEALMSPPAPNEELLTAAERFKERTSK